MVWVGTDFSIPGKRISEFAVVMTIMMAILMVSNIKFHSFKEVDLKGKVPFITVLIVVFLYSLIAWDPPKVLFSMSFLYALSGPALLFKDTFLEKRLNILAFYIKKK
jgi:CDP-diacylglycerol--serine O-phosphatidyltransferase